MRGTDASVPAFSRADWQRWIVAFAGAGAAVALVLWGFHGPVFRSPSLPMPTNRAAIELAPATEQARMHDTIPLFLPTEHDATVSLPAREGGGNILDYDASRLWFDAGLNLTATLPPAVTLNGKTAGQAKPVDLLAAGLTGQPLVGFGRTEARTAPLPSRGGYIEVISATGRRIVAEKLPPEAGPPTNKEWQPMEFAAVIDPSGPSIPLRVTESSRVEEVDAYFTTFLIEKFRLGERLRPGFYRVTVGP